ncbi:MAG: hypothetical protein Q4C72_07015 [Eubacteriales bacterium]|nr:hypothetical protein [Eubacteriales bacterium]
MRKRIGLGLQAAGGLLLFLAAGASDAGTVAAGGLALGVLYAGLLFAAGKRLARRKPTPRRRATVVLPFPEKRLDCGCARNRSTGVCARP